MPRSAVYLPVDSGADEPSEDAHIFPFAKGGDTYEKDAPITGA
jgi:hypothetical protein